MSEENWLPINRGDYGIGLIVRLYAPDLERTESRKNKLITASALALRIYWPEEAALNGSWTPPPVVRIN